MAPRTSAGLSKKSGGKCTSGITDGKGGPPSKLNSFVSSNEVTVETSKEDTTASMKQAVMTLAEKVVTIEERSLFLGDLISIKRGTKEV